MSKEEKLNINITLTDESGFIVKGKSKVTLEAVQRYQGVSQSIYIRRNIRNDVRTIKPKQR